MNIPGHKSLLGLRDIHKHIGHHICQILFIVPTLWIIRQNVVFFLHLFQQTHADTQRITIGETLDDFIKRLVKYPLVHLFDLFFLPPILEIVHTLEIERTPAHRATLVIILALHVPFLYTLAAKVVTTHKFAGCVVRVADGALHGCLDLLIAFVKHN